jgi:type III secretory pathway component EscR
MTKEHWIGFGLAMIFSGFIFAPVIKAHNEFEQMKDAKINQIIYSGK